MWKAQLGLLSREYGAYALSSVYLLSFLLNIFLLCRIRFGDIVITKVTTIPYKASLVYLAGMSAQSCMVAVLAQYRREEKSFAKFAGFTQAVYEISHTLQLILFLIFILIRIHEQASIL